MSNRYKFYATPGPKVVCVSHYAGKPVRGVAICSDQDEYDFDKGCAIAQARVDVSITERRMRRAMDKYYEAYNALKAADDHFEKMRIYVGDAEIQHDAAIAHLSQLLDEA